MGRNAHWAGLSARDLGSLHVLAVDGAEAFEALGDLRVRIRLPDVVPETRIDARQRARVKPAPPLD
jgi:hypothetical protein